MHYSALSDSGQFASQRTLNNFSQVMNSKESAIHTSSPGLLQPILIDKNNIISTEAIVEEHEPMQQQENVDGWDIKWVMKQQNN